MQVIEQCEPPNNQPQTPCWSNWRTLPNKIDCCFNQFPNGTTHRLRPCSLHTPVCLNPLPATLKISAWYNQVSRRETSSVKSFWTRIWKRCWDLDWIIIFSARDHRDLNKPSTSGQGTCCGGISTSIFQQQGRPTRMQNVPVRDVIHLAAWKNAGFWHFFWQRIGISQPKRALLSKITSACEKNSVSHPLRGVKNRYFFRRLKKIFYENPNRRWSP